MFVGLALCIAPREAAAVLVHRYSFSGDANDSVGGANGTVVDPGAATAVFAGSELDLSANTGQGSNGITEDAYVDLPNGIVTAAANGGAVGKLSVEVWATSATNRNWAALFSAGTSNGGEDQSPAGDAADYIQLIPQNGANGQIRTTTHRMNVGAEGFVDYTAPMSTTQQTHLVSVYDQSAGLPGTVTLYVNGQLINSAPIAAGLNVGAMIDNNNWLGRSQWNDPVFDGKYSEFRIYDDALTSAQVATDAFFGPDTLNPGELLSLTVNKSTGAVTMKNNSTAAIDVDFYRISSAASALSLGGWNSLDDQNYDAVDGPDVGSVAGDTPGEGWDQAGGSNASQLVEEFLAAAGSSIAPSEVLDLGNAFNTSVFGVGNDGDLQFMFGLVGGLQITGNVNYVTGPAGVLGDYNNNGTVDTADYVVWRNSVGPGSLPNEGGISPGVVDTADYNFWRMRFGATSGSGAAVGAAVPEPAAWIATALAVSLQLLFCAPRQ